MATQAPIKVSAQTKERIHYLAALLGSSQASIVDAAVEEYAARHASELEAGLKRARQALMSGSAAEIAFLLDEDIAAVQRVSGQPKAREET